MTETALREPWSRLSRQREASTFGMWVFLASELLFFSGMILAYSAARYFDPQGFFDGARRTNVAFGTTNTVILLVSSFAIAMAAQAADARKRRATLVLLSATVALGLAFLVVKGFEYREDLSEGLFPGAGFPIAQRGAEIFFSLYWTMTAVHAVHLTVGAVLVTRLAIVAGRRELPLTSPEISATALYWHLVDVIWIALYPLLYLTGRS